MEMQSLKQLRYRCAAYRVDEEIVGGVVYLHVLVYKWDSSVLKDMYNVFVQLQDLYKGMGLSKMATFSPNPKFCKLFGGTTTNEFYLDDKRIEVIEWVLK